MQQHLRRQDFGDGLAGKLGGAEPCGLLISGVQGFDAEGARTIDAQEEHGVGRVVENAAPALLGFEQRGLGAPPAGDVEQRAADPGWLAVAIANEGLMDFKDESRPALGQVGTDKGRQGSQPGEFLGDDPAAEFALLGANHHPDRLTHQFGGIVAEQGALGAVDAAEPSLGIDFVIGDGGFIEQFAEARARRVGLLRRLRQDQNVGNLGPVIAERNSHQKRRGGGATLRG